RFGLVARGYRPTRPVAGHFRWRACRPRPLDGEAAVDVYRLLHEIEVPFNGRDQVDLRQPGKPVGQGPRALRPEIGGLVHRTAGSARRGAVLPGHARHVFSLHLVEYANYI